MTFFDSLKKWFYTRNSSAASSDARVPLLDASGNPKGSDTMANLASALGVRQMITMGSSDNANTFIARMGVLVYTSTIQGGASGLPSDAVYGIIEVYPYSQNRVLQVYQGLDDLSYKKVRKSDNAGASWTNWV